MLGFQPAVEHGTRFRTVAGIFFPAALAGLAGGAACAQAQTPSASPQQPPAAPVPLQQQASMNAAAPCVQPAPMVQLQDYDGPLKKVVGAFARPLERKA